MKNNMKIPKKLKIELPCYPGIQILGTPNKMKSLSALPYSMASFFTLDNIQKKHRWPKRWMAKEKVLCISKGILFINEEEWNTALCNTWMDLDSIMLNEISQKRKTNTVWSHIHVASEKLNLLQREGRMVVTRGKEIEEMGRYWQIGPNFQLKINFWGIKKINRFKFYKGNKSLTR